MPAIANVTDLDLMEQGLTSLECIERDGPILADTLQCMFLGPATDWKIGMLHDWSVPFLAHDHDHKGEPCWSEVQECFVCGAVRAARFGPYMAALVAIQETRP